MAPINDAVDVEEVELGFSVSHQKLDLELDLASRQLRGRTEITVNPHTKDLKFLRFNCRQCDLKGLTINGKPAISVRYEDCYKRAKLPWKAAVQNVHQYHMVQERLEKYMNDEPEHELVLGIPKSVKIEELDPYSEETQSLLLSKSLGGNKRGSDISPIDLAQGPRTGIDEADRFTPITVFIEYEIKRVRDCIQFVGLEPGDQRYPHAYTLMTGGPGTASCLFPCIDDSTARCTWEISVRTPKTIGDLVGRKKLLKLKVNGVSNGSKSRHKTNAELGNEAFHDEDKLLELTVLCSGDLIDETSDPHDPTKKITSFICPREISAQHVGFAVGPFEEIDLASFRGEDEDDRLGQNAIPVHAYCLPGRGEEVRNSCHPLIQALDHITITFGSFPYSSYSLCFVDDAPADVLHNAMLSICSSRLLFSEEVLDQIEPVTRQLVHAMANQWVGIDIVPKMTEDIWAIVGMAYFITDTFMRKLFGRNNHRFKHKQAADRVVELDTDRPSLMDIGPLLDLDPSLLEFMTLKAPLVLFILDSRILKGGNSLGVIRIISRVLLNAKVGDIPNGTLDTAYFIKLCERISHAKLESFFTQWVANAGCPKFRVTQKFNKKKLVVEMLISQVQDDSARDKALEPKTFMRDVREEQQEVYAGPVQPCFTGPMTIRIHEADGTPYEHIVEIKERIQKFEIPYNTKYKRLKRNRRQKDRVSKTGEAEYTGDDTGDVLLYCLGDVLQSEEEAVDWRLTDWSAEDEEQMSQESYEWIRMDADFEWICRMALSMPGYMWVSQLQQDRDVVAQYESVQFLDGQGGHPLIATFLIRTLMDSRYFHGIRTAAAAALAKNAKHASQYVALFHLEKAFEEYFCLPHSSMTRPNDFSDRAAYLIQCEIPLAVANVRDPAGRSPIRARRWLLEKLMYNDNSNNDYSDSHYIAILLTSLARAMATRPPIHEVDEMDDTGEDDIRLQRACIAEIDRYRRTDEWIPSYHNIISQAALDCKTMLVQSRILEYDPIDYLQYTSDATSSLLRLKAFDHISVLSQANNPVNLRYFLFVLGNDSSTFFRDQCLLILGRVIGSMAIGQHKTQGQAAGSTGDLIVENEDKLAADLKADQARKFTVVGALEALKKEVQSNTVLQEGLWTAITSPVISLRQMWSLLEICDRLFIPRTSLYFTFPLQSFYSFHNNGNGKVVFKKTGKYRDTPLVLKKKPIKLRLSSGAGASGLTASPSPAPAAESMKPEAVRRESSSGAPRMIFKAPKPPMQRQVSGNSASSADAGLGSPDGENKPLKLKIKFGKVASGSPT